MVDAIKSFYLDEVITEFKDVRAIKGASEGLAPVELGIS